MDPQKPVDTGLLDSIKTVFTTPTAVASYNLHRWMLEEAREHARAMGALCSVDDESSETSSAQHHEDMTQSRQLVRTALWVRGSYIRGSVDGMPAVEPKWSTIRRSSTNNNRGSKVHPDHHRQSETHQYVPRIHQTPTHHVTAEKQYQLELEELQKHREEIKRQQEELERQQKQQQQLDESETTDFTTETSTSWESEDERKKKNKKTFNKAKHTKSAPIKEDDEKTNKKGAFSRLFGWGGKKTDQDVGKKTDRDNIEENQKKHKHYVSGDAHDPKPHLHKAHHPLHDTLHPLHDTLQPTWDPNKRVGDQPLPKSSDTIEISGKELSDSEYDSSLEAIIRGKYIKKESLMDKQDRKCVLRGNHNNNMVPSQNDAAVVKQDQTCVRGNHNNNMVASTYNDANVLKTNIKQYIIPKHNYYTSGDVNQYNYITAKDNNNSANDDNDDVDDEESGATNTNNNHNALVSLGSRNNNSNNSTIIGLQEMLSPPGSLEASSSSSASSVTSSESSESSGASSTTSATSPPMSSAAPRSSASPPKLLMDDESNRPDLLDDESNRPDLLEMTTPHTHVFHDNNGTVCAIKITPVLQGDATGGRGGGSLDEAKYSVVSCNDKKTITIDSTETGDKSVKAGDTVVQAGDKCVKAGDKSVKADYQKKTN